MNMTALIVTDNNDQYHVFESYLRANDIAVQGSSFLPQEMERKLETAAAQILLVDADHSERALDVVSRAQRLTPRPAVFVCMESRTAVLEREFVNHGAMYTFSREMSESMIVDCIVKIYNNHMSEQRHEMVFPELVRILRFCHINARQRGYHAIYDCVHLLYRMQGSGMPLTKKVYPSIAKKNGTTPTRLEKNIRDAIKNAWESGGNETIPEYLGCPADRPPTNGQLIMAICEKLRENMAELEAGRQPAYV